MTQIPHSPREFWVAPGCVRKEMRSKSYERRERQSHLGRSNSVHLMVGTFRL